MGGKSRQVIKECGVVYHYPFPWCLLTNIYNG